MIRLLSMLLTLPLVLVFVAAAGLVLSLEAEPLVGHGAALNRQDVERAKRILQQQDPRGTAYGLSRLELSENDLNLALGHVLQQHLDGRALVSLSPGRLHGQFTWHLPKNLTRPYLNVALDVEAQNGRSRITGLRLGQLDLPVELDGRWLADLLGRIFSREELPLIHSRVRRLVIGPRGMTLYYQWDPELLNQARGLVMDDAERETVLLHYRALALRLRQSPDSLAKLLRDSLRLAAERSREQGDEITENRAALVALGLYALGQGADRLLGSGESLPALPAGWVRLQGREDLARHFLVSAALSASSDSALSDVIGLYKEWSDSRGGSGFSFVDLAADRAGTRFGAAATTDAVSARRLLRIAAGELGDQDLLPPVQDLPENMSEEDFQQAFGGIGEPRYQRMLDTIERRLDALPLYNKKK